MSGWEIRDKRVVLTGGNSGIGLETAVALAKAGAQVLFTSRSESKGNAALDEIKRRSQSTKVRCERLDLASFASIRAFAAKLLADEQPIHLLINNAGLALTERSETEEGFETTFGVNHLGHFLLTQLLEERIRASAPARIINVASNAHYKTRGLDFGDLQGTRNYSGVNAYCRSKLANVLFTTELARRLAGSGVTANALHPGVVATGFAQDGDVSGPVGLLFKVARPLFISAAKGARTTIHLATAPEVGALSGEYFANCKQKKPSRSARDAGIAAKLWKVSDALVAEKLA